MKTTLALLLISFSVICYAANTVYSDQNSITKTSGTPSNSKYTDDIYTEFANGSDYQYQKNSNEQIQFNIFQDMRAVCNSGLCTIFSLSDEGNEFTTTFKVGYGPNQISTDPNINVYGGFVGLELKYTYKNCTHRVQVPRYTYIAVETAMAKMLDENGDLVKNFPASTNAIIVFYSTIMSNAKGCK